MRFLFTIRVTSGCGERGALLFHAKLWGPAEKSGEKIGKQLTGIERLLSARLSIRFHDYFLIYFLQHHYKVGTIYPCLTDEKTKEVETTSTR